MYNDLQSPIKQKQLPQITSGMGLEHSNVGLLPLVTYGKLITTKVTKFKCVLATEVSWTWWFVPYVCRWAVWFFEVRRWGFYLPGQFKGTDALSVFERRGSWGRDQSPEYLEVLQGMTFFFSRGKQFPSSEDSCHSKNLFKQQQQKMPFIKHSISYYSLLSFTLRCLLLFIWSVWELTFPV